MTHPSAVVLVRAAAGNPAILQVHPRVFRTLAARRSVVFDRGAIGAPTAEISDFLLTFAEEGLSQDAENFSAVAQLHFANAQAGRLLEQNRGQPSG